MLRPGGVVEIYSVVVGRDVFYSRIFVKKQITVGVDRLVEYAVDCYMKLGYEPAVLKVHRIFTVNYPAKHAD